MASKTKLRANQIQIEEVLNNSAAFASTTKAGSLRIATQPEVDAGTATDLAVTPATLSGALASRNWLYANDGDNFATAPQTSGSGAITIGDNSISYLQAIAIGGGVTAQQNSVAIGLSSNASGLSALALGHLAQANSNYQVSIGYNMPAGSPEYSVRIGYAQADANLNYLRLRNKGQFEIFGDQAQFVLPNYSSGGSPALPTDTIEGALVYDAATKELRLHDGVSWTALSGLFTEDGQFNISGGTGAGAALLASAQFNFLGGAYAGDSITSGDRNVAVGYYAGSNITTTSFNVAVGNGAMSRTDALVMGDFNVAVGSNAGRTIRSTGSDYNVFVGANSGSDSSAGGGNVQNNVGVGGSALSKLTAGGYSNVAIGRFSITNGTTIDRNTAVGTNTFRILDTGSNNVAMGYKSGYWVDGASSGNVIIGAYAGPTSTTVENNKLYINNAASATPLIGGDFATSAGSPLTGQVTIYGDLNSKGILTLSDGTVTQPSLVFEANSTSGITSNGASGNVYLVSGGQAKFVITSGFNSSTVTHFFTTGSASAPSIGYSADTNTGIYFVNPGELHITTGGVDRLGVLSDGSLSVAGTANYENLVTDDDDIPNKKYVDDSIAIGGGAAYLDQLLDVTLTGSPAPEFGDTLIYSAAGSPVQWVHAPAVKVIASDDNIIGGIGAGAAVITGQTNKNVFLGTDAGASFTSTNSRNVAIGHQAASTSSAGNLSVVVGAFACPGAANGTVSIGAYSGQFSTGAHNTFVGRNAGRGGGSFTGAQNIAVGYGAGASLQSGKDNILLGFRSGNGLSTGTYNVGVGRWALAKNPTTGDWNTAIGHHAGYNVQSGDNNVVIGRGAGPTSAQSNQLYIDSLSGFGGSDTPLIHGHFTNDTVTINGEFNVSNTAAGSPSRFSEIKLHDNVNNAVTVITNAPLTGSPVGDTRFQLPADNGQSGRFLQTDGAGNTSWQVAAGSISVLNDLTDVTLGSPVDNQVLTYSGGVWANQAPAPAAFTLDANDNLYAGTSALSSLTSGQDNFAGGEYAGRNITSGFHNIAIGHRAVEDLTIGSNNIGLGYSSCGGGSISTPTGSHNVAVGGNALLILSGTAARNTALGYEAGRAVYTGTDNTFIGYETGDQTNVMSGDFNTVLGSQSGTELKNDANNNTLIGALAGGLIADGDGNVCLGYAAGPATGSTAISNTLWINNSQSDAPLIHGDFSTAVATINGTLAVTGTDSTFAFPNHAILAGSPATFPTSPVEGSTIYDTNTKGVYLYGGSPTGWQTIEPSVAGASIQLSWKFSTDTTATDPGSKNIKFNNATPASVTAIYVNDITSNGVDASTIISALESGDGMYIQQSDISANFILATLSGTPTDNTGWWTIPVTIDDSGLAITNKRTCGVIIVHAAGATSNNWLHANNGSDFATAPISTGTRSIALGNNASTATFNDCVAIGSNATNNQLNETAVGLNCITSGAASTAVGNNMDATANASVAIGTDGTITGNSAILIGRSGFARGAADIVIGEYANTSTGGSRSVVIGRNANTSTNVNRAVVIGELNQAGLDNQVVIGNNLAAADVTSDVAYSVKVGTGLADANKNMLHLFNKGKLELYGDEAQFILPNYVGSPAALPATTIAGGLVYDINAQGLMVNAGSPTGWVAVGGSSNNWLTANNGSDFGSAPTATGANAIALGYGATAQSVRGIAVGYNADTGTGSENIAIGDAADIQGGANNIVIGNGASTTGSNATQIVIGKSASSTNLRNIAIGYNTTANATSAIAMGVSTSTGTAAHYSVAVGYNSTADLYSQVVIGRQISNADVTTDVNYSVKLGFAGSDLDRNMLHLHSKGKLELYGNEAQFVIPNYILTGSPIAFPANAQEGALIYDSTAKGLQVYGGSPAGWSAVGGGASTLNDLTDVIITGSPAEVSGDVLGFNGSNWVNQTAGGAPVMSWLFDTATSGTAPAAGYVRYSTTSPISTVNFNFSDTTNEGYDASRLLENINIGDQLWLVQEDDESVYAFGTVDGHPTSATGQVTVPVLVGTGFGSTQPAAGARMILTKMPGRTFSLIGATGNDTGDIFIGPNAGNPAGTQGDNICIGNQAGTDMGSLANTNLFIGDEAGRAQSSGDRTIAIGDRAFGNSAVSSNARDHIFIGRQSGFDAVGSGYHSIAIGTFASRYERGNQNTWVGPYSGCQQAAGNNGSSFNIGIGRRAGHNISSGDDNVFVGTYAGANVTTGSGNVCIGKRAGPTTDVSDQLFIDSDTAASNTPLIHGNFSTGDVTINGNFTVTGTFTGGGTSALNDLSDVSAGSPVADASLIQYDSDTGTWLATDTLELKAYNETGISYGTTGSIALDTSTGTYFYPTGTTTGSITFSFTNPGAGSPVPPRVTTITLEMLGAANNAPVWPGSVVWANGVEPSWTTGTDIVSFFTRDAGTTWYGSAVILNDATIDLNNADIVNARSITFNGEVTITPAGSPLTATADWTAGQKQKVTITTATTVAFTAPTGQSNLTLKLINGGAGTLTWPGTVKWASGTEPSWTTTGTDIVSFYYDGTNYYGMAGLAFA